MEAATGGSKGTAPRRGTGATPAGVSWTTTYAWNEGSLGGASGGCPPRPLSPPLPQLDEAEREHLFALARESGTSGHRRSSEGTRNPGDRHYCRSWTPSPTLLPGSETVTPRRARHRTNSPAPSIHLSWPILDVRRTPPASLLCIPWRPRAVLRRSPYDQVTRMRRRCCGLRRATIRTMRKLIWIPSR